MARMEPWQLRSALAALHERALHEPRLRAEAQRARREFFGTDAAPAAAHPASAEQRFQEWFLLERESESLGAVPSEALRLDEPQTALTGSLVGVFSVQQLTADCSGDAIDLQDDDGCELTAPRGALQVGDLLVGRLYPQAGGSWLPSTAVAVYRPGTALAAAFRRDLVRLDLGRRLTQQELEHLLLARNLDALPPAPSSPRPEPLTAELEQLLAAGGARWSAAEIDASLQTAARPGTVIDPLLEQLAFDTKVDLDRARRLLLQLWAAHHARTAEAPAPEPAPEPAPGPASGDAGPHDETLGERLVRTLDEGLAQHRDVEDLFRQLEAMAGIDTEADADDAPADPGDDVGLDIGDLGPLVQEYLWETGRTGSEVARTLESFVQLQQNAAVPHTDLELITAPDVMRLLLHAYLGAAPLERAAAVRAAFAVLREFYAWAEVTQEVTVRPVLEQCRGALLDQLDRLQSLGIALGSTATPAAKPTLLRVEDVARDGIGVRTDDDSSHWLPVPTATAALARPGDLLLGALQDTARGAALAGLVVALPADAEALIG